MTPLFHEYEDFSGRKALIGLSGGINSAAVVCWLGNFPEDCKPAEVHLYYAHFAEHSPDTLQFALDVWTWATNRFDKVFYTQEDNSILEYFEESNMIPHPKFSPCSLDLKITPMNDYKKQHGIDLDVVGYVRGEISRIKRMESKQKNADKVFPIADMENEWCFLYVKQHIGWYPAIYDIINRKGKRVFKHNNCLPCKNMEPVDYEAVKTHFPEYAERAEATAKKLGAYWGRGNGKDGCTVCRFD